MKKYIYLFLLITLIFSCSDSETDNSIENLTTEEHIQLIKNYEGKIEIGFYELPEVSQNHINELENNITAELILYAENIGYEVKLRRQSRSLVSLLNIIYIYFDENGELLFDENYDILEEWENYTCFDIQFPFSVTMPDGSQISINSEDELYEAVDLYYEMSDNYDGYPEINFPISIIFYFENENGNEQQEVIEIVSYEELQMYFDVCADEDSDGWNYESWFEIDCVDIVYPISIENPDGDIIYVESEYYLNEYIDQYYQNCNSDDCGDFSLVYPLTVEYHSETNDQTQILTINSEEELQELLDEYCYNDGDEEDGFDTCGEIVYPVTVAAPNGDQFTGNSEEEIMTFIEEWSSNNCNTMECDTDFELVFPITMEFEDNQGDIIVMTIQSEVMLEEITGQYCED